MSLGLKKTQKILNLSNKKINREEKRKGQCYLMKLDDTSTSKIHA
jgi:hypothetical protein